MVEDAHFQIPEGSIAALIGPNGSGKTTLMKAILGLIPLRSGDVFLFGKHAHQVRHLAGYVPQRFSFDGSFPITVREFLRLGQSRGCSPSVLREKIQEVGLTPLVLERRLGTLSGGQLQRVLIAQAILNNPSILFLDEPSTGIDVSGEALLHDVIQHLNREHGTTVFMVSHDLAMVSDMVDTVVCINRRILCAGAPREVLTHRTLAELFGDRSGVYEHWHDEVPHVHEKIRSHPNAH